MRADAVVDVTTKAMNRARHIMHLQQVRETGYVQTQLLSIRLIGTCGYKHAKDF